MAYNNKGYYIRVKAIQDLAAKHYEPERHDRCYKWVWRNYIRPVYGIGYHTFLRNLKEEVKVDEAEQRLSPHKQLSLFGEGGE